MKQERERLLKLVEEGKISESDFKLLNEALSKSPGRFRLTDWMFNPFRKLAGLQSLGFGVAGALIMSVAAAASYQYGYLHFPGPLDLQVEKPGAEFSRALLIAVYQQAVSVFCL